MPTPPALKAVLDASKAAVPQSAPIVPAQSLPSDKTAQINSGVSIGAQSSNVPASPSVNINIGTPSAKPAPDPTIPGNPGYNSKIPPAVPNPVGQSGGTGDWIGGTPKPVVVPPVVKPVVPAVTPTPATGIPGSPEQIKVGEDAAAKNLADLAAEAERQKQIQKTNEDLLIANATSANVDKQALLAESQAELTRLTEEKNKLIASSGDIQKAEVKNAYDANQRAIDLQRKKVAQQYQDLQDEQELANVQAKVRDETKTGLIYGGFGSDAANKNIEDTIARGVKALQIVKRDSINADTEIQNKVLELNDAYVTDMNKIEQWKAEQVNSNYDELSKYVMQIKSDKLTSETDKNTAITKAITDYNTKVAEISASVAQTKYNLGQSLITRSDNLTQEMFQNKITTEKLAEEKRVSGINEARSNLDLLLNTYSTQKFTAVPADVKNKMLDLEKSGGLPQGFSKQAFEVAKQAAEKKDTVEKEFTDDNGNVTLVKYNWTTKKLETQNLGQIGKGDKTTTGNVKLERVYNEQTDKYEWVNPYTGAPVTPPPAGGTRPTGTPQDALAVPDNTKGGQCGAFVNDYTGLGLGNSYQSKIDKMDPNITTPEPGMVFVMPIGSTKDDPDGDGIGHAGFIMSVSGNTATVKDSNWNKKSAPEEVTTHDIPLSKITGFARVTGNPAATQPTPGTAQTPVQQAVQSYVDRFTSGELTQADAIKEITDATPDPKQQENYKKIFLQMIQGPTPKPGTDNAVISPKTRVEFDEIQSTFENADDKGKKEIESLRSAVSDLTQEEAIAYLDRKFAYSPQGLQFFYTLLTK